MLFGFFLCTEKTFRLVPRARYLKFLPEFCSTGSTKYPYIIPQNSQVFPNFIRLSEYSEFASQNTHIPLFTAATVNEQGVVNVIDPTTNPSSNTSPFCLIFYPNPQEPPTDLSEIDDKVAPLVKEYWSTIEPMFICRDMSGYYLGTNKDPNIVMFEQVDQNSSQGECWISKITSNFNQSLCYTTGEPEFSSDKIYLRKVSKQRH
jgi:hypothetical protein